MKVKIFNTCISVDELENQIAKWTDEVNPKIHDVKFDCKPMHSFNPNREKLVLDQQWEQYVSIVIYSLI